VVGPLGVRPIGILALHTASIRRESRWIQAKLRRVPRYRFRAPSTGRELIIEDPEPGKVYVDHETGEELEVAAQVLPLWPGSSRLPWSVEYLRFCNWCDQLTQKDLNDCPTCGRRMAPVVHST
jgi:hypothetical protein